MKFILLAITCLTAQMSFAQIAHSENEPRLQKAILQAITEKCGDIVQLDLVEQTELVVTTDHGVPGVNYHSVIQGKMVYDQTLSDLVYVTVDSTYSDIIIKDSDVRGIYKIISVTCGQ